MVGAIGFEPTAPCSQSKYSTRLSYAPKKHIKPFNNNKAVIRFVSKAPTAPNSGINSPARPGSLSLIALR